MRDQAITDEASTLVVSDAPFQREILTRTNSALTSTRSLGIPSDIRQLVRDAGMTRPMPARAFGRSLAHVALWALLGSTGVAVGSVWLWVVVWTIQGYMLQGAYTALHDSSHYTMYGSRRANRISAMVWGAPLLLNASLWRAWHLEHHRATGTADDPEPKIEFRSRLAYLAAFPGGGLSMVGAFWVHSVAALFGRPPMYARRHGATAAMRLDSLVILAVTVAAAVGFWQRPYLTLALWGMPFAMHWLVFSVALGLPEHYATRTSGSQLEITRSMGTYRLTRFIQWNSNFHAAHHAVPSVSYHFLPQLDAALGARIPHRSRTYWEFHRDQLRALPLLRRRPAVAQSST